MYLQTQQNHLVYVNDNLPFYTDKYALVLYMRYEQLLKSMAAHL